MPTISTCRAFSRVTQILCTGLSAILLPFRQILGCSNHREYSRAEREQSRLHHFRQHRSISNWRWNICPSPPSHPGHPFSWILPPFPIKYAHFYHTTSYEARCIPQLGIRSFHSNSIHLPTAWAATRSSCRKRFGTKRGRKWGGFDI